MAKQRCVTVNAVAMFRGVRESTYRPYLCTDYRHARHVASRRICPHIHVLCMPACMPMSARPRSGSPHDDALVGRAGASPPSLTTCARYTTVTIPYIFLNVSTRFFFTVTSRHFTQCACAEFTCSTPHVQY